MSEFGLDLGHLREHVVRPAIINLGLYSAAAENLLVGTALVESRARYLVQIQGPARGLWQMEPTTHDDIWANFLAFQPDLARRVRNCAVRYNEPDEMIWNLRYAAAMARVHYRRVSEKLPQAHDAQGMAVYWKRYYNTLRGAGTIDAALPFFKVACGGSGNAPNHDVPAQS